MYNRIGDSSSSSSLYFSDALLAEVCVESDRPVLSLRSRDVVSTAGASMAGRSSVEL